MRRLVLGVATFALATMTLSWAMAGDQDIAREITEQLRNEQEAGNLRGFNINLKVADGNVRLEGQVSDGEQQELAAEIASNVEGVKNVINDLVIRTAQSAADPKATLAKPEAVDDGEIASQIAQTLSEHKKAGLLKRFSVDVQVADGEVTMKGVVTSEEQRDLVIAAAEAADGVQAVLSQLSVKEPQAEPVEPVAEPKPVLAESQPKAADDPAESVSNALYQAEQAAAVQAEQTATARAEQQEKDRQIGEMLTQALQKARDRGYLQGFGIGVHVDNGYAWLKGNVSSEEQKTIALEIARRIPGVREVINDLVVNEPVFDETGNESLVAIAEEIGQRLQTAETLGSLRGANMEVRVASDTILLSGVVASADQERLAVELARQVSGKDNVESELTIAPEEYAQPVTATVELSSTPEEAPQQQLQPPQSIGPVPVPVSNGAAQPGYVMTTAPMPQGVMTTAPMPQMMAPVADTRYVATNQTPRPLGATRLASYAGAAAVAPFAIMGQAAGMGMGPAHMPSPGYTQVPSRYDHPNLPGYAWPSYAAHPNYAAVTYPKQYSPTAWPYIGPFYPYPQVPLGWRKVTLKWDDGWWQLDFNAK